MPVLLALASAVSTCSVSAIVDTKLEPRLSTLASKLRQSSQLMTHDHRSSDFNLINVNDFSPSFTHFDRVSFNEVIYEEMNAGTARRLGQRK